MSIARQRKGKKTTVSIVGAGRLGTALAKALFSSSYEIEAVVARRIAHARRATSLLSPATLALSEKDLQALPASKIILITTPDGEISTTAARIAALSDQRRAAERSCIQWRPGRFRGACSACGSGIATGSLHPLVSISDPRTGSKTPRRFLLSRR